MTNFWLENASAPGTHVLVDLGYTANAEQNYLTLKPYLSKANFQRIANDRMVARIPPSKVKKVLAALPQIKEGEAGYCWCTHGFPGVKGQPL